MGEVAEDAESTIARNGKRSVGGRVAGTIDHERRGPVPCTNKISGWLGRLREIRAAEGGDSEQQRWP